MKVYIACSRSLLGLAYPHEHHRWLEARGHDVYAPWLDTDQNKSAEEIMEQNITAIRLCDEVHVFWDGASHGTLLDIGAALALDKPIFGMMGAFRTPSAWSLMSLPTDSEITGLRMY